MEKECAEQSEHVERSGDIDSESLTLSVKSIALQRIVDEVENHGDINLEGYNRSYHRHNR
ncbi:MAG TPA: YhhA family cyclophane-containing RiPP, partial [Steroidobacteraceae bacterium]|nr:YhhA family cyclophane-containing RiPP [Steroidobacteraceae bacterium]